MKIISVNTGQPQPIQNAKSSGKTSIFKIAASGPVRVTFLGLEGDTICDVENHGGVDQAVYVYGGPDYEWWSRELGRELAPGTFGENLTISDLVSAGFAIGDRLLISDSQLDNGNMVILEVTAPRIPCVTLAARMGDPQFVKRFRYAERPGLYCRVIQEGFVQAGDPIRLERYAGEILTAIEMFRDFYEGKTDEATVRRHLNAPIAIRDRVEKEKLLKKRFSP
jgi:MOSC domain-containing protein YiiM